MWVDRSGEVLDPLDKRNMLASHPVERVRRARLHGEGGSCTYLDDGGSGMARVSVTLSLLLVRWADTNCDEVKEGDSGWGPTGAVVSDSYINFWLEAIDCAMPFDYQLVTAWVASSEDMTKLAAQGPMMRHLLLGRHIGTFSFLWPAQCLDAQHIPSGYVDLPSVYLALQSLESAGIPTRFPHPSHLYKVFLSKDWTSQLCLSADFRIPATTKVSRAMYERDPAGAARKALESLDAIARATHASRAHLPGGHVKWGSPGGARQAAAEIHPWASRGVAKLGYSWEANDVLKFQGEGELAVRMGRLFHQAQGTAEFCFVQELIEDFDCECRTFVINGRPMRHARRYTSFAEPAATDDEDGREAGRYSQFVRGGRDMALAKWLRGNERALVDAEAKMDALIAKYCTWLTTECAELPPVFRFDAFLRIKPKPNGTKSRGKERSMCTKQNRSATKSRSPRLSCVCVCLSLSLSSSFCARPRDASGVARRRVRRVQRRAHGVGRVHARLGPLGHGQQPLHGRHWQLPRRLPVQGPRLRVQGTTGPQPRRHLAFRGGPQAAAGAVGGESGGRRGALGQRQGRRRRGRRLRR